MADHIVCTGVVKVFNQLKGYGFITREKGRDVFFHFTDIDLEDKDKSLFEGDYVEFILSGVGKKLRALKVKKVG